MLSHIPFCDDGNVLCVLSNMSATGYHMATELLNVADVTEELNFSLYLTLI